MSRAPAKQQPKPITTDALAAYVPPNNIEAEQSVLGSMLIERDAISKAVSIVNVDDFYRDTHQKLFKVVFELDHKNEPIDLITLSEELKRRDIFEAIGGFSYLTSLFDTTPTAANVEHYARIVAKAASNRRLIATFLEGIGAVRCPEPEDPEVIAEDVIKSLVAITQHQSDEGLRDWAPDLVQTFDHWVDMHMDPEAHRGLMTGLRDFDAFTRGLKRGNLIIIAGRPSMGKTAIALQMALNMAKEQGARVAIFSLESSRPEIILRMVSNFTEIDSLAIGNAGLKKSEIDRIDGEISLGMIGLPIHIDDRPNQTVQSIQAKSRRMQANGDLDLIIVDYLTRIKGSGKNELRAQEVGEIARDLKTMARELNVPVICLAQLSRANVGREDKWPQMSDLRDSGEIEQEADVIGLLHRPSYYSKHKVHPTEENGRPGAHYTGLLLDKNRNGPTGLCHLGFLEPYTKFVDWIGDPPDDKQASTPQTYLRDDEPTPF